MERSECCKAGARAGRRGPPPHPGRAPVSGAPHRLPAAPGPAPARTRRAAATGRLRAERKPRAQTGRGGWCERLGPVPARRGWNTMSRAGGRAGSENSLTQQLGKWVCSLTRSTALAACGQRRLDSRRLPRAGGRGEAGARPAPGLPPLPAARDLHVARLRIPLPSRPCVSRVSRPPAQRSRLGPPGRGALLPSGRCGLACSFLFPPKPTTLGGLWRSWCGGCNSSLQMGVEICSRVVGSTGRGC